MRIVKFAVLVGVGMSAIAAPLVALENPGGNGQADARFPSVQALTGQTQEVGDNRAVRVSLIPPSVPRSDLEAYPGFRYVDWRLDEEIFEREEMAREVSTAACMKSAGWPYTPSPSVYIESDSEYIESDSDAANVSVSNENDKYVATLAPASRKDYFLALYGVSDPFAENLVLTGNRGCSGESFKELPGVYAAVTQLRPELYAMKTEMRSDVAALKGTQVWSACMARAGHVVESREELLANVDAGSPDAWSMMETDRDQCATALEDARQAVRIRHENMFALKHKKVLVEHAEMVEQAKGLVTRYLGDQ